MIIINKLFKDNLGVSLNKNNKQNSQKLNYFYSKKNFEEISFVIPFFINIS